MCMYKLQPACKEYIWGGDKLKTSYGKIFGGEKLAETWELSVHKDGGSVVLDGFFAGESLENLIDKEGEKILGTNCVEFEEFPLLIKFIDAKDNLSIQVHPDDKYARTVEGQFGKTEMWYVADCEEGAFLYHGFSKDISKEEFGERIENGTLLDVLNKVSVKKGDVFFIEAGTIHAIGKDIVIAEIQQNSNVTYRVFDYGRVDKNGIARELHVEKALEVTKRNMQERVEAKEGRLAECEYFTVDKMVSKSGETQKFIASNKSFVHALVLEGGGILADSKTSMEIKKGDSVFITAGSGEINVLGNCELLLSQVGKKRKDILPISLLAREDVSSNIYCYQKILRNYMMSNQESALWQLCDGDVERLGASAVFACMKKEQSCKSIISQYAEFLALDILLSQKKNPAKQIKIESFFSDKSQDFLKVLMEKIDEICVKKNLKFDCELRIS